LFYISILERDSDQDREIPSTLLILDENGQNIKAGKDYGLIMIEYCLKPTFAYPPVFSLILIRRIRQDSVANR